MNCNWETEDWCDMGTDSNGCWMGNWCQDKSMGGCPAPMGGSELASGEDICAHMTHTEECGASQISCDNCPGMCSTNCNWDTEEWCDMGVDSNGCWLGNFCQDINAGGCPVMTKRGSMEKLRALAVKTDRSASGSGYSASGSGYTFGSGSD